jgi:malic enzyme
MSPPLLDQGWQSAGSFLTTGSPFDPVFIGGREHRIGQSNNVFIFPGVGVGMMLSEAREVTDGMFAAAARQLAAEVSAEDLEAGSLFPAPGRIREVTAHVAEAVIREAMASGFANRTLDEARLADLVAAAMWDPVYLPADPAPPAPPKEVKAGPKEELPTCALV